MTGFGLGTLPALLAAAYGISLLKTLGGRKPIQAAGGVAMAAIGFSSLYFPWPETLTFCITR